MAHQQEEGWPLGLQPVNERAGLGRDHDLFGSISFNTLISASPTCSTNSSSDLDTESTGSFFHDKSITLGSLIGVTNVLKLSRRSLRRNKTETRGAIINNKNKGRTWSCFSLCSSKHSRDTNESVKNVPSLGHFLAVERKASNDESNIRNQSHDTIYNNGPDEFVQPVCEPNSLFIDGRVAPPPLPQSSTTQADMTKKNRGFESSLGFLGFRCCFHACMDSTSHNQTD